MPAMLPAALLVCCVGAASGAPLSPVERKQALRASSCTWEVAEPSGMHWSGGSDNEVVAAANDTACQQACCASADGCDAYTYNFNGAADEACTLWKHVPTAMIWSPGWTSGRKKNCVRENCTQPCSVHADCPVSQYCDEASCCYECSYLNYSKAECDAVDGSCCSAAFLDNCPSNPKDCPCRMALETVCKAERRTFDCVMCAGANEETLRDAGCTDNEIKTWCGVHPPPPATFPSSRLLTPEWAVTLNKWFGNISQVWKLCCSTFEGCDTAAKFHAACDGHNATLTAARNAGGTGRYGLTNPGNFTFGGFAAGSWSFDACCAVPGNACWRDDHVCIDHASSSDWLFGLWPGPPQRFEPTGNETWGSPSYQVVFPDAWPRWGQGNGDLNIGYNGTPGGEAANCNQGNAYRGTYGEICGGGETWGATDVEVWYPRPP